MLTYFENRFTNIYLRGYIRYLDKNTDHVKHDSRNLTTIDYNYYLKSLLLKNGALNADKDDFLPHKNVIKISTTTDY